MVKKEATSTSITDSEHHPAINLSDTWLTHHDDIQLTGHTEFGKLCQTIAREIVKCTFKKKKREKDINI